MPYEDNFGFYCADDDPEELAFFNHVRSQSTAKNVCVANKWCAYCHKISCAQHAHNLLNMERHQNQLGPSLIIG